MESRRAFIKQSAMAGVGLPLMGTKLVQDRAGADSTKKCPVCIFSKHLQFLEDYDDLADALLEAGLDGVDLGVRPGSHVEPDRVEEDLPRAVEAITKRDLLVPMMVTRIGDPEDPKTERVLKTSSQLGIKHYRMAYYRYEESLGMKKNLEKYRQMMKGLAGINESYQIHGAYQNHSGTLVGAPLWDLWLLLDGLNPEWIGCQYDIRHATAEGTGSWPLGLELLKPFIKCIVFKDSKWEKIKGKWRAVYVPLGEGIIEVDRFLGYLKESGFSGPVSMHFEYPFYDESDTSITLKQKRQIALSHIKRDVDFLNQKLKESGLN
jgi:sugar phosphate isomerase/epimerase